MLRSFLSGLVLMVLLACQPLTPVDLPGPSPTVNIPQAGASVDPAGPDESPTPDAAPLPTPSPRPPEPEPTVLQPPGHAASVAPSQQPYPGRLEGTVFDDQGQPLNGVRLRLRSLDSSQPFEAQTETQAGAYLFEGLPTGLQLELRAERPGFTPRAQVLTLTAASAAQQLNFAPPLHALSDRPEVQAVSPAADLPLLQRPELVLTFSEPMERNSVMQHLVVHLATAYRPAVRGDAMALPAETLVWDQRAFVFDWSPDDSRLTLRFRDGAGLPGDSDAERLPHYALGFKGPIADKLGVSRSQDFFRLGQTVSSQLVFVGAQDRSLPAFEAVQALSAERHGAAQGDLIRVRYSKPMRWQTLAYTLVGGMNQNSAEAPAGHDLVSPAEAAANYRVSVQRGEQLLLSGLPWSVLGGQVHFEPLDPLQQIVRLEAPAVALTGDQKAGTALTGALATVSGRIYYRDGSDVLFDLTPEASTWAALQTSLNALLDGSPFTARKSNNQQGALTSGDSWRIMLAANARSLDTEKTVALVLIHPEGLFAPERLNAPAEGLRVFPGLAANTRADLFRTGDQVKVQIAQSVRDPAGNSLLSSASQAEISAD